MTRVALVVGVLAVGLAPALAQERPNPHSGGGGQAVSRPSGGSGSSGSSGGSTSSTTDSGSSSSGSSSSGYAVPRRGRTGTARGGGSAVGKPQSVVVPVDREIGERQRTGYGRERGNRPVTGYAAPRDISNLPDLQWRRDPYYAYGWYPYRTWWPMNWGPWGGYLYYDPFWWDYYYGYYPGYYGTYGGGGGYTQSYSETSYETGKLKLKVKPREAQVYVDGYFSGVVDDYDGVFQSLKLTGGGHRIELRAEGFEPSFYDVLIVEDQTVTLRADLQRKP